ncbi:sperm-associated antigen 7 homolog [Condylostylus longicornis]|uniref:sperm-associated antigen 7 homolog n=1 Tax=Condylostylus longicornis TaxID=2530218 RepID=UPI00244DB5FB|nr:sperm-associated antigen 7 homolog [Condylostylus longicornis]
MDLLGSILNSMDKPPAINEKDKEAIRRQKEQAEKMKLKEKQELNRFRKYTEERISRFSKDDRKFIEFQILDKLYRTIIHDVAEIGGLVAMSFGQEGIDRYTVVYKKDHPPTEDEIHARRNGEGWNDEIAKEYAERRQQMRIIEINAKKEDKEPIKEIVPVSNYKDKYAHLIGQDAALQAARKTESNKVYGFVPSENKKDCRSIEQTMADIQAKKRLKTQHQKSNISQPINNDGIINIIVPSKTDGKK